MTEPNETHNCHCCFLTTLFYAFVAFFVVVAVLWQTKFKYHVKMILYLHCFIVGGFVGGVISLPFGRTPDNHFRIFKIFQILSSFMRLKFHVRNKEKYASMDEPCVVIGNHQSCIDVLTLTHCWPQNCVVMLKSSLKFLPGFNLCAFVCNSIYINRFSKEKAHKTVDNTIHEILSNKRKVFIYPEGTRNSDNKMLPFKKGAFIIAKEANIPIVPCVASHYKNFYNYEERRFDDTGDIIVEYLPPVDSTKFKTVDELSDHCYKIMQEARERLDEEVATKFSNKKSQ